MTDNTKNPDPFAGRQVEVQLIRAGSPEHAAVIAQETGLSPPPEPQSTTDQPNDSTRRPRESAPSSERHERKCIVCSHPERADIDYFFLQWHNPWNISAAYQVPTRSLYRHAHATGLYAARQGNLRSVLDRLLEKVESATVSGDCVIRAVRAYSCLGGDNRWTEPATRLIHSYEPHLSAAKAPIEVAARRKSLRSRARSRRKSNSRKRRPDQGRRPERASRAEGSLLIDTEAIRK